MRKDVFKNANQIQATAEDYNAKCCKRHKGQGKKLRRYARHRLSEHDREEIRQIIKLKEILKRGWQNPKPML